MFYIFSLLILFFFSIKGYDKRGLIIILLFLSFFLGFRDETVGEDTSSYVEYYDLLSLDIFSGYMEKGWNLIAVICKQFSFSAYVFNFVVAIITLMAICPVCTQFNNKKINGVAVFLLFSLGFYLHMFNIMRQFLAISIVLIGYSYLAKGQKKKFIITILIASFVHLASLFALLMVFYDKFRFTTKKAILLLLSSFLMGIIASESFFLLFAGKYAHDVVDETGIRSGFVLYLLTMGLFTNVFTIWLYKIVPELKNNAWVKFNIISVVVFNLMSRLVWGTRVVYFFSICSIIAYSLYAVNTKKKIVPFMIYLFAIVTFIRYLAPEVLKYGIEGSLVPYAMNFQIFAE